MLYPALRLVRRPQSRRIAVWHRCGVTTATPKHPNPGNFANRSREEISEIGHRGGKKGGIARGVGGFHDMDPEKQHAIASRGAYATRKAARSWQNLRPRHISAKLEWVQFIDVRMNLPWCHPRLKNGRHEQMTEIVASH